MQIKVEAPTGLFCKRSSMSSDGKEMFIRMDECDLYYFNEMVSSYTPNYVRTKKACVMCTDWCLCLSSEDMYLCIFFVPSSMYSLHDSSLS